jgi:hypothetical protein
VTHRDRWDAVRQLVAQLPGTSERIFDSGALRFYVGDKCFAYQSPDLTSLVVAIDRQEWEALHLAAEPCRQPLQPATPRQHARYAALALDRMDPREAAAAIREAWAVCAPKALRNGRSA